MSGGDQDDYHSAAECIQAGMYWFSQSDLAAAEAWWRRALELEPDKRAGGVLSSPRPEDLQHRVQAGLVGALARGFGASS